ncbi:MAG: hypothetical protein J6T15_05270 [Bacilli bacterium]|nr:hypothetical protein [Bacilli bacterium]
MEEEQTEKKVYPRIKRHFIELYKKGDFMVLEVTPYLRRVAFKKKRVKESKIYVIHLEDLE